MDNNNDGLMNVFSNKVFLSVLVVVVAMGIFFFEKTESRIKENQSQITYNVIR